MLSRTRVDDTGVVLILAKPRGMVGNYNKYAMKCTVQANRWGATK